MPARPRYLRGRHQWNKRTRDGFMRAIEHFKEALSTYRSAKGSVQFPLGSPIPYSLIKKIVKFRVKENREKIAAQPKKKRSAPS